MTDGSRSLPPPPVKATAWTRSGMPSSAPSSRFARSSSPSASCDDGGVVHHLLSLRIAFRLRAEQTTNEKKTRILQPEIRRTGTTIEPETFSRAGAIARFAFRRGHDTPPGEPRRSTSPSGARLASCCVPLRVLHVSGSRRLSLSLRACAAPAWGRDASGLRPTALRSSTELTTSSRRAAFRRPAAPSWQAT